MIKIKYKINTPDKQDIEAQNVKRRLKPSWTTKRRKVLCAVAQIDPLEEVSRFCKVLAANDANTDPDGWVAAMVFINNAESLKPMLHNGSWVVSIDGEDL